MPDYDPPARFSGLPNKFLLPADATLWYVHPRGRKPTDFAPADARRRAGRGRFDGPYPSYNAGLRAAPALANVLLGGIPRAPGRARTIRRAAVVGQRVSVLSTTVELCLVSLCDAGDLRAVGQDLWLIHDAEIDNPRLRRWAAAIRTWAPIAQGFIWPPPGVVHERVLVLFGDRCDSGVLHQTPLFTADLDDGFGAQWLNSVLVEYRVRVNPPRRGR